MLNVERSGIFLIVFVLELLHWMIMGVAIRSFGYLLNVEKSGICLQMDMDCGLFLLD